MDQALLGIGLAAVQVGVAKRIVVIDIAKRKDDAKSAVALLYLLNPEIVWACEELSTYNEGCRPVPNISRTCSVPCVRARHRAARA